MCLDVSYMAVLLEEGYGLKPQTKIKVRMCSRVLLTGVKYHFEDMRKRNKIELKKTWLINCYDLTKILSEFEKYNFILFTNVCCL